jgi:lysozyme
MPTTTQHKRNLGGVLGALVALLGVEEGTRLSAYYDSRGVPTICTGETPGVKMGDTATEEECFDMTVEQATRSLAVVDKAFGKIQPDHVRIAFASFEYNVGETGFLRSTARRKIVAGDREGGCRAMALYNGWNDARGHHILPGLVKRRTKEINICLSPP